MESSRSIVCRRGEHLKKSRSQVTEQSPGGEDLSLNVVRFARLLQGRHVMTPPKLNSRKDERSPLKILVLKIGAWWWVRRISNFLRRGTW